MESNSSWFYIRNQNVYMKNNVDGSKEQKWYFDEHELMGSKLKSAL